MALDSGKVRGFVDKNVAGPIVPGAARVRHDPQPVAGVRPALARARPHGPRRRAARDWVAQRPVPGLTLEVVRLEGRTPLLWMEVPGDRRRHRAALRPSRQAAADGGLDARARPVDAGVRAATAVRPRRRRRRLLDLRLRGGDPGPAAQRVPHARCVVLIEACEESGSFDLPAYIDALADRIGTPSLVICLDSGCGNYDQLWVTTSLRGLVGGTLTVEVLTEGVHSGAASGIVPSSFRVARQLLDRARRRAHRARSGRASSTSTSRRERADAGGARPPRCSAPACTTSFPFAAGTAPVTHRSPSCSSTAPGARRSRSSAPAVCRRSRTPATCCARTPR